MNYESLTEKNAQQRYSSLSETDQEPGTRLVIQQYTPIKTQSPEEQQALFKGIEINKQRDSILNTPHPFKLKLLIGNNFLKEKERIEALPLEQQVFEFQRLSEATKNAQQRIKNIFAPTQKLFGEMLPGKTLTAITGKKRLLSEEDMSTVNPWIIVGAELGATIYNIALLSQIAGAIGLTNAVSGGIWKALPIALKATKWGSYGARILANAPMTAGIFGTEAFTSEALNQIADRKFSPIDITKKTAEAGLFGLVTTPAFALPTAPLRILGNAFVMGGWTAAEKLIRDGEITKEDLPEITANAALGMAFSLIHAKSTTRIFEATRMADVNRFLLEGKLPGTPIEKAKIADLMGKIHGLRVSDPNFNKSNENPIIKSLDNKLQAYFLYKRDVQYIVQKDGKAISPNEASTKTLSSLLTAEEKILLEQINQTPGLPLIPQVPTEPAYVARAPQEVVKNFEAAESIITKLDSINTKTDIPVQPKPKRTTIPAPKIPYPQSVIRSREEVDNSILANIETGGALSSENIRTVLGITDADEISQELNQVLVSEEL